MKLKKKDKSENRQKKTQRKKIKLGRNLKKKIKKHQTAIKRKRKKKMMKMIEKVDIGVRVKNQLNEIYIKFYLILNS
jgi:hypothetical protein